MFQLGTVEFFRIQDQNWRGYYELRNYNFISEWQSYFKNVFLSGKETHKKYKKEKLAIF